MEKMVMNKSFWKNKKILVTGHTGFKGSWLSLWLDYLGADVIGLSLEPPTKKNLYTKAKIKTKILSLRGDIRDYKVVRSVIKKYKPDIIFHLAAQALVLDSYKLPLETYQTNVLGSLNVLEAARQSINKKCSIIMVTTDKCYKNDEKGKSFKECSELGGKDMYSSSKASAEIMIQSYRESFLPSSRYKNHKIGIASVRGGNVIGGGDWSKDRLIPDIINSLPLKKRLNIRNPKSVRPWQHVFDLLNGYIILAEKLYLDGKSYSEAWNFGPKPKDFRNVEWIAKELINIWESKKIIFTNKTNLPNEANLLFLNSSKSRKRLKWKPKYNLKNTLTKIVEWHKEELINKDMLEFSTNQLKDFISNK